MVAKVAMNGKIFSFVIKTPLIKPGENAGRDAACKSLEKPVGAEQRRNDAAHCGNASHRQVDASRHDDKAHAKGNEGKHRIVAQNRLHIVGAEEPVIAQGRQSKRE